MTWSEWITPAPDVYAPAVRQISAGRVLSEDSATGDRNVPSVIESYREQLATGGGVSVGLNNLSAIAAVTSQASKDFLPTTSTYLFEAQGILQLQGSQYADQFDWLPTELSALQRGVDYDVRPDRQPSDEDAYVQYEFDHTTFLGWQDWTILATFTRVDLSDLVGAPWTGSGFTLRVAWSAAVSPTLPEGPWYTYGHGSQLASINVPVSLHLGPAATQLGDHVSIAVPLSGITESDLTLLTQPSLLGTTSAPVPTTDITAGQGFQAGFELNLVQGFARPMIGYQRPRWRYWMPDLQPVDSALDNIFYSRSGTDGNRWSDASRVIRRLPGTTPSVAGQSIHDSFYLHGLTAVHTDDNLVLVAVEHHNIISGHGVDADFWQSPAESGARAALAVLNYQPAGTSQFLGNDVIFKGVHPTL